MSDPLDINLSQTHTRTREQSFLRNVYTCMTMALIITGLTAYFTASSGLVRYMQGPIFWILVIGTLGLTWFMPSMIMKLSVSSATLLFAAYAVLEGMLLSWVFLAFASSTIYSAFFISAGTFAVMAIYGATTKKDLSSMGSYLLMGLFGLIIASLVNMFMRSSGFAMLINYAAVLIYVLLTAFQTQQLKRMANKMNQSDNVNFLRVGIIAAFSLYLTFIGLFIRILLILGRRD